jgi:dTDP-4-dehydrorhamnose 3,5-epimerase
MSRFIIRDTHIQGLKTIERQQLGDSRGFLSRILCTEEMAMAGWHKPVAQINHTFTQKKGTVRGMHFQQFPFAEMKLVTCLRGVVWDIAVDLRAESPTFLQWYGEEISVENRRSMLIPEGVAHGFQSLSDDCEMLYLHTAIYMPEAEGGVNPEDPSLAIAWPLTIAEISNRDAKHPMLDHQFKGVML